MLADLYRCASLRAKLAHRLQPFGGTGSPHPGVRLLAIFLIGCVGTLTGSAAGMGIKALNAGEPALLTVAVAKPAPVEMQVPVEVPAVVPAPVVVVPAPAAVAVQVAPAAKPAPRAVVKAPAFVPAPPPPAPGPVVGPPVAKCAANETMDDAKIHWLLEQSANTLAENPSQAAGAARVNADLRGALGKNLCASEAQVLIANTCTDPAAVTFLNTMVNRLPFYIKPMVGNPCTADLVSVLNKMGKFIT